VVSGSSGTWYWLLVSVAFVVGGFDCLSPSRGYSIIITRRFLGIHRSIGVHKTVYKVCDGSLTIGSGVSGNNKSAVKRACRGVVCADMLPINTRDSTQINLHRM
nr:hypothetical protein [Tanacetum cinerariifolium]